MVLLHLKSQQRDLNPRYEPVISGAGNSCFPDLSGLGCKISADARPSTPATDRQQPGSVPAVGALSA